MNNIEVIQKDAFCVIGKPGSTNDGPDFIQKLWQDANGHFSAVEHLAKRDDEGNLLGVWGVMTNFNMEFLPWEENFSKGLYMAGVEVERDALPPKGWKKWIVPGFTYWKVKAEGPETFRDTLAVMEKKQQRLVAAVQDFTDPKTGENYMLFPVEWNQSKEALIRGVKDSVRQVGVCSIHCEFCFLGKWCGGCRSSCGVCSYATLSDDNVCPNVRCAWERQLDSCSQCPELLGCTVGFYQQPNAATHRGTALFVKRHGEEAYTRVLSRGIAAGLRYTDDLDAQEDEQGVCSLLERYLDGC